MSELVDLFVSRCVLAATLDRRSCVAVIGLAGIIVGCPAGDDAGTSGPDTAAPDATSIDAASGGAKSETSGATGCMICQPVCSTPADCCPPPDQLPPGISCPDDFPFDFQCPDGVCRPGGCTTDADCGYFPGPAQICIVAAGVGRCRRACTSDSDCETQGGPPISPRCDGVSERGMSYCGALGEPQCDLEVEPSPSCTDPICRCLDGGDCRPAPAAPPRAGQRQPRRARAVEPHPNGYPCHSHRSVSGSVCRSTLPSTWPASSA